MTIAPSHLPVMLVSWLLYFTSFAGFLLQHLFCPHTLLPVYLSKVSQPLPSREPMAPRTSGAASLWLLPSVHVPLWSCELANQKQEAREFICVLSPTDPHTVWAHLYWDLPKVPGDRQENPLKTGLELQCLHRTHPQGGLE